MRKSRVPDTYAESLNHGEAASRFRSEVITGLLKEAEDIGREDRIIDAGCGYGFLLQRLEQAGFSNILGVEAIPSVASQVREVAGRVLEGDLEEGVEELHGAEAAVVVCSEVLEHLYDPAAAIREMRSWLRSSGRLVVSVPNEYRLGQRLRMLAGRPIADVSMVGGHIKFFSWESLARMIRVNGFTVDEQFALGWGRTRRLIPGYDRLVKLFPRLLGAWIFAVAKVSRSETGYSS